MAAISLHLIDGILAASVQCCCYDLSAENICMKFLFQLEGWLYNSHPPHIGSPATAGSATFRGLQCRAQQSPQFIPLVTYLLLQYNCKKCYTLCPTTDENRKNKELFYKPIYVGLRSTTLRSSGYGLLEGFRRTRKPYTRYLMCCAYQYLYLFYKTLSLSFSFYPPT